jgi:tRNA-dihydrouridine synthase 2
MTTATTPPVTGEHESPAPPALLKHHDVPHVPIPSRGVDYRNKVALAPMVRSGELPSRLLALKYGADLVWGPETIDRSMIGCTMRENPRTGCLEWSRVSHEKENILYRIDPRREGGKLIYQVGTNDPKRAVEAMKMFAPHVSGIDVNAGCPKPFSTDGGMGAALLKTPDLLASILKALVEEVGNPHEIGISVKIRLLETPEMTSELVHKLCSTGITGLTIHCRTAPMRKTARAIRDQLKMIGDICRSHGVACLMNGDVSSREEGEQLAKEFGIDGSMIATAAEANSSVFRAESEGGKAPWQEVVHEYIKLALSVENKFGNTKFLLSQLIPGRNPVYQRVQQCRSHVDLIKALEYDDEELGEAAVEADALMNLNEPRRTAHDIKKENKKLNKERQMANIARKQALGEHTNRQQKQRAGSGKRQASTSPAPTKKQKAEIASENAGFDPREVAEGQGAMAVAV